MFKSAMLASLVAFLLFTAFAIYVIKKGKDYNYAQVGINGHIVNVEVASNPTTRAKGLMHREELDKDAGMLFVFPTEGKHRFWMANTYISLDIIWIEKDKTIVHIEENVPSCEETGNLQSICTTYKPDDRAKYVLEVNAGWIAEKGVVVGDSVKLMQ